jgi:hypothetical protein
MARTFVDLPLALRSISINRMNVARKVRREMKREVVNMKVLQEQSELESSLLLISHNVNQLRKAFSRIAKLEKRIKERKERHKHPRDRMAGRNRGNFSNR